MALMFQRLARNFIKNGCFPTDEETTALILAVVVPSDDPRSVLWRRSGVGRGRPPPRGGRARHCGVL
jgi:hypothetical protein